MRVILERSNLLKSLNHVHRVVERRNTIPILSNVMLGAEGQSLELKATDLDLEITEATPAQVEQAGGTTVPAHLLYEIVRKLPDGAEVMLRTDDDGNCHVGGRRAVQFPLAVPAAVGFPATDGRVLHPSLPPGFRDAEEAHRQDAVRDLDRRNALLPERHLPSTPSRQAAS